MLFLEFHGSDGRAWPSSRSALARLRRSSVVDRSSGDPPEDRSKLWQARHDAYWAARSLRAGAAAVATDVLRADLTACAMRGRDQPDIADSRLVAPIVGPRRRWQFPSYAAGRPCRCGEVARAKALSERLWHERWRWMGLNRPSRVGQGKMGPISGRARASRASDANAGHQRALDRMAS